MYLYQTERAEGRDVTLPLNIEPLELPIFFITLLVTMMTITHCPFLISQFSLNFYFHLVAKTLSVQHTLRDQLSPSLRLMGCENECLRVNVIIPPAARYTKVGTVSDILSLISFAELLSPHVAALGQIMSGQWGR